MIRSFIISIVVVAGGLVVVSCQGRGEAGGSAESDEVAEAQGAGARSDAGAAEGGEAATPAALTVVAKEYTFAVPTGITAGVNTFQLSNQGREGHHMQLYRLEEGKTAADLLDAIRNAGPHQPLPQWAVEAGGPNAVMPGGTSQATMDLEPGSYVMVCWVPDSAGVPHLFKGMVQAFEIPAAEGGESTREMPPADMTMRLVDYDFELSQPLQPGPVRVRVDNAGEQAHEVQIFRLGPGKTMADLEEWLAKIMKPEGPPPGEWIGGVAGIEAGDEASFAASLEPGEYALICFVTDEKDGKFHFDHGMIRPVTVGGTAEAGGSVRSSDEEGTGTAGDRPARRRSPPAAGERVAAEAGS